MFGCACWSVSLLFANLRRQVFSRRGPYVNGGHIIWMCSTSSNTQIIRLQPTVRGNGGDFDFQVAGPWHDPVLTAHLAGWGMVTNGWCAKFISPLCTSYLGPLPTHLPPPPQPKAMSRTFILCLQFAIVLNHHTMGTASWQNHDSLLLYCTAMVAYV